MEGAALGEVAWSALVPKSETQAGAFARDVADGRGIIAAVLDTGIDLQAAGLRTCPDGAPKIVDVVDASGAGDVSMAVVRDAVDGCVESVGGRRLRLNAAWRNPSGKWRVGSKAAYELYPQGLVDRLRRERKKDLDEVRPAECDQCDLCVCVCVVCMRASRRRVLDSYRGCVTGARCVHREPAPRGQGQERHGGGHRRAQRTRPHRGRRTHAGLCSLVRPFPIPCVRCVSEYLWIYVGAWLALPLSAIRAAQVPQSLTLCVRHDGSVWRAVVDNTESGDLSTLTPLTDYDVERTFATFGTAEQLPYAVHIYENGNVLSIVTVCGSHGTHVAGILAA